MVVIPRKTIPLVIILLLIILGLAVLQAKLPPSPSVPALPTPIPTEPSPLPIVSFTPSPTASASASPSATLTPLSKDPATGWQIYSNPFHRFSVHLPPAWKIEDYGQATQPIMAAATQVNTFPAGFIVSDSSWSQTEFQSASPAGQFSHQGWIGTRYQQQQNQTTYTLVTATKTTPQGLTLRINWLYPSQNGSLESLLKPILNTFTFTP
ncbi:hypothetical protein A2W24_05250 [Microgenomates group bacterium RBG_16_45_19]|nr:MAG: hypothetical protein A2W24_05250 [Microgenomates group bacterium RBG_16_45_19]